MLLTGFSTLTQTVGYRGDESPINDCMKALVNYAGRVVPQVVIFESVQGAFFQGINLMRTLRAKLEEDSGKTFHLYHVLHNNASLGGASNRRRYFFVASQVPFGVERVQLDRIPVFNDVLQDLKPLGITWNRQPYRSAPSWWSAQMRDGSGFVDGMEIVRSPLYRRGRFLAESGVDWFEGETVLAPTRRFYEREGYLPVSKRPGDGLWKLERTNSKGEVYKGELAKFIEYNWQATPNALMRWKGYRPANVITGGACHLVWHPHLDRTLTHREAARIQGFPDSWKIEPLRHMGGSIAATWGKGIPVHAGRWISKWAKRSVEGDPGSYSDGPWPKKMGPREDNEHIIDVTNDWKPVFARQESDSAE